MNLRLANIRNGLAYPHEDVCFFQSNHAHSRKIGYFQHDAMPYKAIITLLKGFSITIIDATQHSKKYTDALKFGLPTWCLVYNRALRIRNVRVCDWQTKEMELVANSTTHRNYLGRIRRLAELYQTSQPAIIGENVLLECYSNIIFDDKPEILREAI